ncbi:MAG: Uma2 family endonuclease [Armatimonadota bacterium]
MALTAPHHLPLPEDDAPFPLECGDTLDRETFHARYEAMPEDFRAELIEGIVYLTAAVPGPYSRSHSRFHSTVAAWLSCYGAATPGLESYVSPTIFLGRSELQPDACLLITPSCGGQSGVNGDYLSGAPELVAAVATSHASIDLHATRHLYESAGVQEYVVVLVRQPFVFWFRSVDGRLQQVPPDADGCFRSEVVPGLWLDPAALLRLDSAGVLRKLQEGLASPEHAELVARLAAARGEAEA